MVNVSQVFSQTLDSNKDVLVDWLTPVDKKKKIKYFRNASKDRRERGIHNIYVNICSQMHVWWAQGAPYSLLVPQAIAWSAKPSEALKAWDEWDQILLRSQREMAHAHCCP